MNKFYILFKYKGKNICGCWKEGLNEEDARIKAEWFTICHYPNINWDEALVVNRR